MSKAKESAPSGSKRRVTVRRKGAVPDIDPAIAYAIAAAVEAQDLDRIREIVLKHEAQMHTLRIILFDLLIIFREEHYKAKDVVSKKRFAEHIAKVRATLEQNVPEFKAYHEDANDVDDLDAHTEQDQFMDESIDIAALVQQAADDAAEREGEDEDEPPDLTPDIIDEMLERASEEVDTPSPYDAGARRPHPRSRARSPRRPRR